MFFLFGCVAIGLSLAASNLFYLFNFTYIGGVIALGLALYTNQYRYARLVVQFGVGLYMLVYLGLLCNENMQIEGFWYYLFLGVFEAAAIHYAVAKIFGPLLFGRGWCGYACWTAMILDLLPYKLPEEPRKHFGFIRYLVFVGSLVFVGALFVLAVPNLERVMFWSFLIGNAIYYVVGITLAYLCKDNRAFCKYICPITVFLKPASYYACMRVTVDPKACTSCGKCKKVCPMEVEVNNNARNRKNATECILCMRCVEECPVKALKL